MLIVAKVVAAAVAHADSLEVTDIRERALSASSIREAAESEAKHVALLAAEEAAEAVVVAEACANSVATAAATQAVAVAAAVVVAAAASASKAVEMATSAAYAARMATEAATVAAAAKDARGGPASPSPYRNHRWRVKRLASFIIHRAVRQRAFIRRESRATRIILTILGRLNIILLSHPCLQSCSFFAGCRISCSPSIEACAHAHSTNTSTSTRWPSGLVTHTHSVIHL